MSIPAVVAQRIRRPAPSGLCVIPGSLPVVSFGDPDFAVVATLSLNPSWREVQSQHGEWLLGDQRRLASLVSLEVEDARDLTDKQIAEVVADSCRYFTGPNWYRSWFHWLESLLQGSGAGSYHDGTACHLDLVQWATKPAQGDLARGVWERLVEHDREFLRWQLRHSNVKLVLCNGASIVAELRRTGLVAEVDEDVLTYQTAKGHTKMRLFRAAAEGVVFLGWNRPVATAISSDGRERLRRWLAQVILETTAQRWDPTTETNGDGVVMSVDLEDGGHVPVGTEVDGPGELQQLLAHWMQESNALTVGDVAGYGGSPVIIVHMGSTRFLLNRDTKRAAVRTFLAEAAKAGGAEHLRWHVTTNERGRINRVSYRGDDEPTPGWYAYVRESLAVPQEL